MAKTKEQLTKEIQEKVDREREKREQEAAEAPQKVNVAKEVFEWIAVIIFAILFSFMLHAFVIVNATVPTSSMENTIMAGDRVIGSKLYYLRHDPQRGEIIMFDFPDDPTILYIKRVIGLPGDHIEITGGVVYVNGEALDEPYLNVVTEGEWGPYDVPEGCYFMLGDNRNDSADSRYWKNTYLTRDGIVGKAVLKYWKGFKRFD
ncbi:MAG: signal peptidase I [Lachnospiraceae bacterium]|nr:signal peptidase I [Lachnospiraceae bacterium]